MWYIEVLELRHKLTQHRSEALIQNKEIYPPNLPILALLAISIVFGNETQNVFIRVNFKMLVTKFGRIWPFCLQTNVFEITSCHLFVTQEELLASFQRKIAGDFCFLILIWAEMKIRVHSLATKGYYCSCNLSPEVCTLQVSSRKLALGIQGTQASHLT